MIFKAAKVSVRNLEKCGIRSANAKEWISRTPNTKRTFRLEDQTPNLNFIATSNAVPEIGTVDVVPHVI